MWIFNYCRAHLNEAGVGEKDSYSCLRAVFTPGNDALDSGGITPWSHYVGYSCSYTISPHYVYNPESCSTVFIFPLSSVHILCITTQLHCLLYCVSGIATCCGRVSIEEGHLQGAPGCPYNHLLCKSIFF